MSKSKIYKGEYVWAEAFCFTLFTECFYIFVRSVLEVAITLPSFIAVHLLVYEIAT